MTIDGMAERLQKLLNSEREMLANISHEFRSPLARMQVALELSHDEERLHSSKYLKDIEDDIKELDQLVNDILLAVKLDFGNEDGVAIPLKTKALHLNDVIGQSAHRFQLK